MTDSVMLMDELRREMGGEVYGRDIKSAFNSLARDIMYEVLRQHEENREWVNYFLRPRTFDKRVDGRVIGRTTMTGGTPQGSPLSPTLLTTYMSAMVWQAEKTLGEREKAERKTHGMTTRTGRGDPALKTFIPISYIDDVNSVRVGKPGPMDEVWRRRQQNTGSSGTGQRTGKTTYT